MRLGLRSRQTTVQPDSLHQTSKEPQSNDYLSRSLMLDRNGQAFVPLPCSFTGQGVCDIGHHLAQYLVGGCYKKTMTLAEKMRQILKEAVC